MKVIIADDHLLFLDGLFLLIKELDKNIELVKAVDVKGLKDALVDGADLVVMDLRMPGMKGVRTISGLINSAPNTNFVVISATESETDIDHCYKAGARAFISKSAPSEVMIDTLKAVVTGEYVRGNHVQSPSLGLSKGDDVPPVFTKLSERQLQVLIELSRGKTNKEIAKALNISDHTVKTHIVHLFSLLKVNNRLECAQKAALMGLL